MTETQALRELAQLAGIQTVYYDVAGRRRSASAESLFLVLRQLGVPLEKPADAAEALRAERQRLAGEPCAPVHAAFDGDPGVIPLRLPRHGVPALACRLTCEDGEVRRWTTRPEQLVALDDRPAGAADRNVMGLSLPPAMPHGYHRLELEAEAFACESLILSAPREAFQSHERLWGIFVPPYALTTEASWGAGSFSDLGVAADWLRCLGGRVLATLPMLAAFLDEPFDHSPYAPASRLFWNEFYVDVTRARELEHCAEARELCASADVRAEIAALKSGHMVDYRRVMRLKRRILELLAGHFFAHPTERRRAFDAYVEAHPAVASYAEFRAVLDRRRVSWRQWPARQRDGTLHESDYDASAKQYHLYAQWLAHEQVHELGAKLRDAGTRLYLDLPLGSHANGYDVWQQQDLFMAGLSAGAPPDSVFTRGQDWGFPPVHPRRMREQGYAHFIDLLRHHLRSAGVLRIDHVMALHRLFCIPRAHEPRDGVYVRYPANELYAILAIESHRHAATIVGENLGTVPAYVNRSMAAHGLQRMYVMQYELGPGERSVLRPVPKNAVASVNTHDMPPFAAYWQGQDISLRESQGLLDSAGAQREREQREQLRNSVRNRLEQRGELACGQQHSAQAILEACLAFLSASPARVALVSLEDLWLEERPQNVPATASEMPNWQRKLRYDYEEFSRMRSVLTCLERVDSLRRKGEYADD